MNRQLSLNCICDPIFVGINESLWKLSDRIKSRNLSLSLGPFPEIPQLEREDRSAELERLVIENLNCCYKRWKNIWSSVVLVSPSCCAAGSKVNLSSLLVRKATPSIAAQNRKSGADVIVVSAPRQIIFFPGQMCCVRELRGKTSFACCACNYNDCVL